VAYSGHTTSDGSSAMTDEFQATSIVDPRTPLDPVGAVLSPDEFKFAFRGLAQGVAIITASAGGERAAMTATSLTSLSATPPLFAFSASTVTSATRVFERAETIVAHILTADSLAIAKLAATSGTDRFGPGVEWDELPTGEPYYPGAHVWIRGRVVNRLTAGSSIVHIVEALSTNATPGITPMSDDTRPLVFHNRTWHALSLATRLD
jgi:flavin reductase (DIM6/NTAB) family NADH-FMN oxidoreductase RutF